MIIPEEKQVMKEADMEREGFIHWANGSKTEDDWVAYAVVWEVEWWEKWWVDIGWQSEVFEAEMNWISEAMKIAEEISGKADISKTKFASWNIICLL